LKDRLDVILTERNIFPSREKAKASIMAGLIYVDGQRVDKPGTPVDTEAEITVKETLCPYVSRGGLKLEKALSLYDFSLEDAVAVDIGASTGGFTDCMLQNGARKVYAIDVGYGQLDWKLRNDNRVINMEKVNIRYLDFDTVDKDVDFISIDVSFISLSLILPVAYKLLGDDGETVCLIKPQFEAGRDKVGKKGVVRDKAVHLEVIEKVINFAVNEGFTVKGLDFSPVKGPEGNIEYLLHIVKKPSDAAKIDAEKTVEEAHQSLSV